MPMKLEKKSATYPHAMDSKNGQSIVIDRNKSVEPNAGLKETVDGLGNKGRLGMSYTVGKSPEVKMASHSEIEGMRPAKSEMKYG